MDLAAELRRGIDPADIPGAEALMDKAADEIERLRAALKDIASMGDEDNEWDGRDKFRNARSFAQRVLDGVTPASVEQELNKGE